MDNEYKLDYIINEFILATLPTSVYATILNIVTTLDKLNIINDRYVDIVNDIETVVLDTIHSDTLTEDDKVPVVKDIIKVRCRKALLIHGLRVTENISLKEIENILLALDNIYNLDNNQHELVQDMISSVDEDGEIHKMSELIANYCSLQTLDVYDLIEDIDNSLFVDFNERFKVIETDEEKLEDNLTEQLEQFSSLNILFTKTVTYKTSLETGEFYNLIKDDAIYTILEMYKTNKELLPFEITLALFSNYKNIDMVSEHVNSINLENISYLEDKHVEISDIENTVIMLINKLKG